VKSCLRENRSVRKKKIDKIIRRHYWPELGRPKLATVADVEDELRILQSDGVDDKVASAMTIGSIATSLWGSDDKRSDAEYSWVRQQVCRKLFGSYFYYH